MKYLTLFCGPSSDNPLKCGLGDNRQLYQICSPVARLCNLVRRENWTRKSMVGEMVQNSQSLYLFTFNAVIVIHEYIYPHSTTKFTFRKYIYSHLMVYFLFTNIFTHIFEMSSFTFNGLYSFTFTIKIFIQHFLRTTFAHHC